MSSIYTHALTVSYCPGIPIHAHAVSTRLFCGQVKEPGDEAIPLQKSHTAWHNNTGDKTGMAVSAMKCNGG